MKKLLFVFVLLFLINGCGQKPDEQAISADLIEYVNKFKNETGIEFHNTDIYLADIPDKENTDYPIIHGRGYPGLGVNIFIINTNTFYDLEEHEKEILIAHEAGHCVLGLDHNDKIKEDGCPVSVMYPHIVQLITINCWNIYKEEYHAEIIEAAKIKVF